MNPSSSSSLPPFQAQACIWHGTPIVDVQFDSVYERLYVTDNDGYLASYTLPDTNVYSSVRTCWIGNYDDTVWSISNLHTYGLRPAIGASGVVVPCGSNLRLYSRGGILQADIPVTALSHPPSSSSVSSSSASVSSSTPTNESILCSLALDSHDRHHHRSSHSSSSELSTSRIIIGGKLSALHLLDATRLWSPLDAHQPKPKHIIPSHTNSSSSSSSASITLPSSTPTGISAFHNRTFHHTIKSIHMVPTTHPITHLSHGENRVLVTANGEGSEITLYDGALRGSASIGKLTGHPGGTLSLDSTRNMIVTVGHSTSGESVGPALGTRSSAFNPSSSSYPPSSSSSTRATLDATLRIYDVRMLRQITSITVPAAGGKSGSGGPVYVKFFPFSSNSGIYPDATPPIVVATADGRMFTCEPDRDRFLQSIGNIDPTYAGMQRASIRGVPFVPTPDTTRLRTPTWCLAPSGNALAAVDTEGFVYLTAPTPLMNTVTSKLGYMSEPVVKYHGSSHDDPWILLSDDYYSSMTNSMMMNNYNSTGNNEDSASALLWQNLMDPTSRKVPPGVPTLLSAGLTTGNYYQPPGNNLNSSIGLGDGTDDDLNLITDSNTRNAIETALAAATTAVNAAKVAATATQNANNAKNTNQQQQQQPLSSFAAAVLGRGSSSTYVREATIAANNATNAINNAEAMLYGSTRQTLPGNSFTVQETIEDGTYDAILLHGTGHDVPVAAPGIGALASTELINPTQPSHNYTIPNYAYPSVPNTEPWSSVWSTTLDKVQFSDTANYWNDTNENTPHPNSGNSGRGGKYGRGYNPYAPKLPGAGYVPAQDRASSFPMDWANETLMVPSRRREVDPTLLALADRTGTYINNRPYHIRLKPNTLLFGKRKGYLDLDPRRKTSGYNESSSRPGGWQLTNPSGGNHPSNGGRSRASSIDSHSSGGSSLDFERLMRGDFDDEELDDDDEDDEDIDNKSITTEASLAELVALTNNVSSPSSSSSSTETGTLTITSTPNKTILHIPRAYRRPKLTATRVGFFDFDFASYNHSPFPFAGFEEVGPNSFVNAALQLLFFARGFRRRIQRHLCSHPACVSCEMRFIFDVACQAPMMPSDSRVATAQNFIRALQYVTEIKRAGLLHPCELEPTRRMSTFIRTIIDRVAREITPSSYLNNGNSNNALANSSSSTGTTDAVTVIPVMGINIDATEDSSPVPPPLPTNHGRNDKYHGGKDKHQQHHHGNTANKYLAPLNENAALNAIVGIPNENTSSNDHSSTIKENAGAESLFGLRTLLVAICVSGHTTEREFTSSMIDLVYPANIFPPPTTSSSSSSVSATPTVTTSSTEGTSSTTPSFSAILNGSLGTHKRTKAWCEECKAYVWLTQYRVCMDAGPLLLISTNPYGGGSDGSVVSAGTAPILNPNASGEASQAIIKDLWTNPSSNQNSWIAKTLQVLPPSTKASTGPTKSTNGNGTATAQPPPGIQIQEYIPHPETLLTDKTSNTVYELVGMVMHINVEASKSKVAKRLLRARRTMNATNDNDSSTPGTAVPPTITSVAQQETTALARYHYVSCLKVNSTGTYATSTNKANDKNDQWLIFNDFRITPSTSKEIFDTKTPWKVPTVLLYQRINHETGLPPSLYGIPSSPTDNPTAYHSFVRQRKALGYVYPSITSAPLGSSVPSNAVSMFTSPWPQPFHPLLADITHIPSTVFALPPSIPHQPMTGAAPLTPIVPVHQVPKDGALVAIDAEFVAVATERSRILADGSRRVLAQARLMPGRVSIVQHNPLADGTTTSDDNPNYGSNNSSKYGSKHGSPNKSTGSSSSSSSSTVPVMDAYISASEPVVDYLTRFSGLMPNDLDPSLSPHRLHTYKDTYMKLRALIDNGTIFIGHGLRKDCRELGIFLPPVQVIDTVKLYKLEGQRYISLKFLSSHVLSSDIQSNVHDSCEDALSALALYNHYRRIHENKVSALTNEMEQSVQEGFGITGENGKETVNSNSSNTNNTGAAGFERLLHHLYDIGRSTGWRARSFTPTPALLPLVSSSSASGSSGSSSQLSSSPGTTSITTLTNMFLQTSLTGSSNGDNSNGSISSNGMGQSLHGLPEDAPGTPQTVLPSLPTTTTTTGNNKRSTLHGSWANPSNVTMTTNNATVPSGLTTQANVFIPSSVPNTSNGGNYGGSSNNNTSNHSIGTGRTYGTTNRNGNNGTSKGSFVSSGKDSTTTNYRSYSGGNNSNYNHTNYTPNDSTNQLMNEGSHSGGTTHHQRHPSSSTTISTNAPSFEPGQTNTTRNNSASRPNSYANRR